MTTKPFAESCEQNKAVILTVIEPLFRDCRNVLEIGSGTGQHAVHFAANMPHLVWHTSDIMENHPGSRCGWRRPPCRIPACRCRWM